MMIIAVACVSVTFIVICLLLFIYYSFILSRKMQSKLKKTEAS